MTLIGRRSCLSRVRPGGGGGGGVGIGGGGLTAGTGPSALKVPDIAGYAPLWIDDFDQPYAGATSTDKLRTDVYDTYHGKASDAHKNDSWWDASHTILDDTHSQVILRNYVDNAVGPGDGRIVSGAFTANVLARGTKDDGSPGYLPGGLPAFCLYLWCTKQEPSPSGGVAAAQMTYGHFGSWPAYGEDDVWENDMGAATTTAKLHYAKPGTVTTSSPGGTDARQVNGTVTLPLSRWVIGGVSYHPGSSGSGTLIRYWSNSGDGTNFLRMYHSIDNVDTSYAGYSQTQRRMIIQCEGKSRVNVNLNHFTDWIAIYAPN